MSDRDLPEAALPEAPMARLRLLVALDALLVIGSVSGAAAALNISTPAASRLLAQLRQLFGDEILSRSGRRMVPTAFAEGLRLRVRALAAEAEAILASPGVALGGTGAQSLGNTNTSGADQAEIAQRRYANPPLALRPSLPLEGQPSEAQVRARLAGIGANHAAGARLGRYIATIGAGQGRTRPLDLAEAEDAFAIVLDGEAEAVQIGALLGLLQYRGLSPVELAGLVRACRRGFDAPGEWAVDLDWPGYLSPFNRNPPWFLLAAKLLGQAGRRIVIHGFGAELSPYEPVLAALDLPVATSIPAAGAHLDETGIAFLPLTAVQPQLQALINLYPQFQMRTPIQLGLQLLNPLGAGVTMMGLPRAALGSLHREALGLLQGGRLLCIDSHRDVAQATPHRLMTLTLSAGQNSQSLSVPASQASRAPPPPPSFSTAQYCAAVWTGQLRSAQADAAVIDTAALALIAMGQAEFAFETARAQARSLWQERNRDLP